MAATRKNVDFTDVRDGSSVNPKRQPAGDYSGKIIEVKDAPAKDGVFQWLFVIKAGTGTYPYYCKLQPNQLWKLRNLFIAAGKNVPKKKIAVDPNVVVGKTIGLTLEDDEYNDKLKSSIASVFPAAELDPSDAKGDDEDDEYEEEEEEEEEEEAPAPPARKRRAAPAPEPEEEEEEDEEEEEEEEPEPTPPPRRRAKKAAPARRSAAPTVTDDELEELDIDSV